MRTFMALVFWAMTWTVVSKSWSGGTARVKPEVVVGAFAGIVVADAGVFVDLKGALVESLGIKRHGYQCSLVAQPAGVEDRADLPQHVLLLQFSQPLQDFILADVQLPANFQVWLFDQGERPLDNIQQLPVGDVHKLGRLLSEIVLAEIVLAEIVLAGSLANDPG